MDKVLQKFDDDTPDRSQSKCADKNGKLGEIELEKYRHKRERNFKIHEQYRHSRKDRT